MMALEGIRVLEFGRVPPAELPGMMLADLGADVIKIDTPKEGPGLTEEEVREAAHSYTNRNKRSIALNLKQQEARDIVSRLAMDTDVVIEGFRPGVAARLGVDYDAVRTINPRVVYCSLSGFGQSGPYRERPAHDLNFLGLSGALGLMGRPGAAPDIPLNLVADYGGAALHGAMAIMTALFVRERSGRGQYLDIAYLDATIALLAATPNLRSIFATGHAPVAGEGVFSGTYPYYTIYDTRDRRMLTVACSEPPLWRNFCEAIGRPDLYRFARMPEHYKRGANAEESAARASVGAVIATRDLDDWDRHFLGINACVARVNSVEEMMRDPQVTHRGLVQEMETQRWGTMRQFRSGLCLSETPATLRRDAPIPGADTHEVLFALGMTSEEIESLTARRVIA
jgi:crotonobetainyl-CoA:carnitine CoA-transferase CaiB-like acyl-CoA transferase